MSGRHIFSMKRKLCVGVVATVAAAVTIICFVSLSHPISSSAVAEDVNHKRSVELEDNSFAASEPKVKCACTYVCG